MMLDQVRDFNQAELYRLSTVADLPDFVKEASQTTPEDIRELPGHAFAWPSHRMLPLHTKHDTWLSAAFFHKHGGEMPEHARSAAMSALQGAAEFWGITLPKRTDIEPMQKKADQTYVISYPLKQAHLCEVSSGVELQKVAADITVPGRYPLAIRRNVAEQVLQAPAEFIGDMAPGMVSVIQKVAGQGVGTESAALQAIGIRRHAVGSYWRDLGQGLEELEGVVKEASHDGLLSHQMTEKTATFLDAVDRFAGLHKQYRSILDSPEQQMFSITLEDFDSFSKAAVRLSNGEWVRRNDIEASLDFLADSFGQKCASVDEAVGYVQQLPERRAKILSTFLKEKGVQVL